MGTFTDTFNRGNGAPGGNWVTISGTPTIAANWLTNNGAASCYLYDTTLNDGDRHECTCRVTTASATSNQAGPIVKWSTGPGAGYFAQITYSAPTYSLSILRGAPGSLTNIASVALAAAPAGIVTITLIWDNGHLTARLSTGESVSVDDATYASGTYMGVRAHYTTAQVDWVTMITGAAPDFQVTPDVIGNYGAATELTFTGTNTNWTSGTPGSPTFTCDHGTLSDQSVASTTSATATYDPGTYLGPVIFTDPSTGLTDTAVVTSDVSALPPPDACLFDEDFIATANATVPGNMDGLVTMESVIVYGDPPDPNLVLPDALRDLWLAHFRTGFPEPEQGSILYRLENLLLILAGNTLPTLSTYEWERTTSIKEELEAVRDSLTALRAPIDWTLAGILNVIVGDDSISTTHLHDDIAAISAGSNQDVLDALAAYFGANPPTIQQLGQMVSDIATIAGYTLGDVLDEIADTQSAVASVGTTLSTVSTNVTNGFQAVLDAIAAIPTATPTAGAPVWPGQASVTFGTPVALSNGMTIDEDMDGVIVTVTTPPTLTGRYVIGSETYDYGVGRIAFESDGGEVEPWQYLGFRAALFTPKSMLRASAVHLQVLAGAQGTVTPWVVS